MRSFECRSTPWLSPAWSWSRLETAPAVGQLAAVGRVERRADQSLAGRLGPADRIEIRWPKPGCGRGRSADRHRRRTGALGHPSRRRPCSRTIPSRASLPGSRTFRVRHDRNLILRSAEVSDLVDGFWVDSAARDEWTLHADPPIRPGSTISIDCWMPIAADREAVAKARLPQPAACSPSDGCRVCSPPGWSGIPGSWEFDDRATGQVGWALCPLPSRLAMRHL